MSVFQITIFFLYIMVAILLATSRLPAHSSRAVTLANTALVAGIAATAWHALTLWNVIISPTGLSLSIGNVASLIGWQLALIAVLGATIDQSLRGLAAGLFVLAAILAALTGWSDAPQMNDTMTDWQIQAHVLISLFAYGLLSSGAIVALFALVQEKRLQVRKIAATNHLFAPLETTEKLLFGIASGGFLGLLLAVFSGFAFVDSLFAQHLVHKTVLSLLALVLFGILIAGRQFAGWRGLRAVYLYLWGFLLLGLAYFGSRFILEEVLGRSWS